MAEREAVFGAGSNNEGSTSRREFVKAASLTAAAVTTGLALTPMSDAAPVAAPAKTMVGFQAEVTYLLQYGIARFLDDVSGARQRQHADAAWQSFRGLMGRDG